MKTVDIRDVAANLDRLIEQAEKGKPFAISIDGKPLVKVSHISRKELDKLPAIDDEESSGGQELASYAGTAGNRHSEPRRTGIWNNWLAARG